MMKTSLFLLIIMVIAVLSTACNQPTADTEAHPTTIGTVIAEGEGEDTVYVAVLAIRSAVAASAQYQPIVTYLSEELGRPFQLVPVGQDAQFTEVEQGNIDFTFNNPLAGVQLRRLYDTRFLATISRANTGTEFGGLIIVHPESGIETLDDLRDKRATCVDFQTAAGGCAFQVFHLLENGFDPFKDFDTFTETPSQDNIVLGVINGTFDVGFIRTGQLERMVAEGTILSIEDVAIFDQAESDFYYPHTTRLYPEWPFAALASTDAELADAVQEALLALTPDHPAMQNAGAEQFVPAVDYTAMNELIERLQLFSWDVR